MGKKTKKIAKKKKKSNDVELEDLAWLTKKSSMAAMENSGSSSKQETLAAKTTVAQCSGVDCSSNVEISSPSVSCSLGCEDSVNDRVAGSSLQNSRKTELKKAGQVFAEMPEPTSNVLFKPVAAKTVCSEDIDECVSSPSVSRTLGEEDSVESKRPKLAGKGSSVREQPVQAADEQVLDSSPKTDSSPKENATWASLFHSNRGLNDDLILSEWVDDSVDINLDTEDIDVVEEVWGFGLIRYVAGKFQAKGQSTNAVNHGVLSSNFTFMPVVG